MDRKEIIQNLKNRRYSYRQIGDYLGISRQRVHQIFQQKNGKGFRDSLRELARIRDNHTCQICGKVWREGQRRFDVHHLDENLEGNNGRKCQNNKNLSKMITLCHKCHMSLAIVKNKMRKRKKSYPQRTH